MNNQECVLQDTTKNIENLCLKKECCGIYGLRNKINGKWYIGQSRNIIDRWNIAYRYAKCKKQPKIFSAIKKYGYDAFEKVIIEECSLDQSVLDSREEHWIKHYNSVELGYNCRTGGSSGGKFSNESKKKMSIAKVGTKRVFSEEHRKRISEAKKGKPNGREGTEWTEEQRKRIMATSDQRAEKVSKKLKGIVFTEERKKNISKSLTGKKLSEETKQKIRASILAKTVN